MRTHRRQQPVGRTGSPQRSSGLPPIRATITSPRGQADPQSRRQLQARDQAATTPRSSGGTTRCSSTSSAPC
eukprot:2033105-Alexandrium_andersonii.AAC.1